LIEATSESGTEKNFVYTKLTKHFSYRLPVFIEAGECPINFVCLNSSSNKKLFDEDMLFLYTQLCPFPFSKWGSSAR